jgi:hypothetical protein
MRKRECQLQQGLEFGTPPGWEVKRQAAGDGVDPESFQPVATGEHGAAVAPQQLGFMELTAAEPEPAGQFTADLPDLSR